MSPILEAALSADCKTDNENARSEMMTTQDAVKSRGFLRDFLTLLPLELGHLYSEKVQHCERAVFSHHHQKYQYQKLHKGSFVEISRWPDTKFSTHNADSDVTTSTLHAVNELTFLRHKPQDDRQTAQRQEARDSSKQLTQENPQFNSMVNGVVVSLVL